MSIGKSRKGVSCHPLFWKLASIYFHLEGVYCKKIDYVLAIDKRLCVHYFGHITVCQLRLSISLTDVGQFVSQAKILTTAVKIVLK